MVQPTPSVPRLAGQYVVCDEIASGGTATVHFGRLLGHGFARTVAIKRLHPAYARDPLFVDMFFDEARLATRIRHPNVCSVLDVVTVDDVPCLVLDYVHGEPLARLIHAAVERGECVPYEIAAGIVSGVLQGLHAAHEASDESGEPLHIIHRDVSPQNVLIGTDGVPRVVDFGLAKAEGRLQNTAEGQLKGKLGYMAPEQFALQSIDRRVDIYSAAVVLWETLTGQFLFERTAPAALMRAIVEGQVRHPCSVVPDIPAELADVCMRGLARDPADRFATAQEMAVAIESAIVLPSPREVGAWVERVAGEVLKQRAAVLAGIEAEHPAAPNAAPGQAGLPAPAHLKPAAAHAPHERALVLGLTVAIMALLVYIAVRDPGTPGPHPHSRRSPMAAALAIASQNDPILPALPAASVEPPPAGASAAPSAPPPRRYRPALACNPPYTVDSDGIRHPKRECFAPRP